MAPSLAAGELVQRSAVVVPESAAPTGRQLSFAIDRADALAGTLEVGEPVDVLATTDDGTEVVRHRRDGGRLSTVATTTWVGGQLVVLLTLTARRRRGGGGQRRAAPGDSPWCGTLTGG